MPRPHDLLKDPNYINANSVTKQAIFDRYVAVTPEFAGANEETQNDIRARFGVSLVPGVRQRSDEFMYGIPGAIAEGVGNIGSSGAQFAKGLADIVAHPVDTAHGMYNLMGGAIYKSLPKAAQKTLDDLDSQFGFGPEKTQAMIDAANNFGGMLKQRYGSYDRVLNTLATDPVGFAADASTILSGGAGIARGAGKVARAGQAAERAAAMAGTTYKTGRSAAATSRAFRNVARGFETAGRAYETAAKYTNPMTAVAPVVRGAAKVVQKAPVAITNMMSPKTAAYMNAAEGRAPEIVNQLRRPDLEIVPGSAPTAAEAASPLGLTKFSALGDAAAKVLPTEYLNRLAEQAAARVRGVQRVGKTPEDLAALKEGRKSTAATKYGAVQDTVVAADDTLRSLMARPSMDAALRRAKELAAEKGVPFQMGPDIKPNTMAGMVTEGRPAQYTVQSIHTLKTAMDDLIRNPERFGIGASEAAAIGKTQKQLVSWLESKAPGYKTARETFAKQSRRINQTEVGQFLEGKLTSALDAERPAAFAEAVKQAPSTIKRATTGESRFQQLTDILEPHQVKEIENIKADLERQALTKTQARQGSAAAPKLSKLATETGVRAPNLLSRVTSVANMIWSRLEGKIDRKLAIQIATEMLDPQAAANALEKASQKVAKAQQRGATGAEAVRAGGRGLQSTPVKIGAQTQSTQTQVPDRVEFPPFNEEGAPLVSIVEYEPGRFAPNYGLNPAQAAAWEKKNGRKYTPPSRVTYERYF